MNSLLSLVKSAFPDYSIDSFPEHSIVSAENLPQQMKFVFTLFDDLVIIDQYYRSPGNSDLYWSEPVQINLHREEVTHDLLCQLRMEFKFQSLFA